MHTPRLCIDARAAREPSSRAIVAQELIDQLVSAQGEEEISSEWVDRNRTVLLTHPGQVFSGQLKRFETRRKVRFNPLSWWWESQFVRHAHVSAFHRFRPADRLLPRLPCPTVTTVLPTRSTRISMVSRAAHHYFVVPSNADRELLVSRYAVDEGRVLVVRPFVRRYVHFHSVPHSRGEGSILFLTGRRERSIDIHRLIKMVSNHLSALPIKVLRLDRSREFSPIAWLQLMANAKVCFYLTSQPFDWPTLALEAVFWNVPTIFLDDHRALTEVLGRGVFQLKRFLVEQPSWDALAAQLEPIREKLLSDGVFEPFHLARQFREVYRSLPYSSSA